MSRVWVCCEADLEEVLRESGARSMIALCGPDKSPSRPGQIDEHYLSLRFNDIVEAREGLVPPKEADVGGIISLARAWDQNTPLLCQCWMGISRSTAAAAIILATLNPGVDPDQVAAGLRLASPMATPNILMIRHADKLLGYEGGLTQSIAAIGRGREASSGQPFSLPADFTS